MSQRRLAPLRQTVRWGIAAGAGLLRWPPTSRARTDYLALLGGGTLHLRATLSDGLEPVTAQICFTHARRVIRTGTELDLPSTVHATVPLSGPSAVGLSVGTWRLSLLVTGPGGTRQSVALDPPATTSGAALVRCPATGKRFEQAAGDGDAPLVRVRSAEPAAEVRRLILWPDLVEIRGELVGVPAPTLAGAVLVSRRGRRQVSAELARFDQAFHLRLPLTAMAQATTGDADTWDIWLHPGTGSRLRVGRFLHGLGNPKELFAFGTYPYARAGQVIQLRPYYTEAGSLALECRRVTTDDGGHR